MFGGEDCIGEGGKGRTGEKELYQSMSKQFIGNARTLSVPALLSQMLLLCHLSVLANQ